MKNHQQAIVIGGSIAGLLAARVLSTHFERVMILERDPVHDEPETRKGQPQCRYAHALLVKGVQILNDYFPDLIAGLKEAGAIVTDMAKEMRWYVNGGYRKQFTLGAPGISVSRPLLEWQIRRRVLALPNVRLRAGCRIEGLSAREENRQIAGVVLARGEQGTAETLQADLVVDATGRGSGTPRWLEALGYPSAEESRRQVDMGYAARLYDRPSHPSGVAEWMLVTPVPFRESRGGIALPIEGDRWIVQVNGLGGDHPPADEQGFRAYARSLPAPDIANIVESSPPLSPIYTTKFPASLRRHYERLTRFPEGYLVLGDALCSFNPRFGQGMTTAAMQAQVLDQLLTEHGPSLQGIARPFFQRAAKIIDLPWQLTLAQDRCCSGTQPRRTLLTWAKLKYMNLMDEASHHDAVVSKAFLEVMNLLKPLASLLSPALMLRVGIKTILW